MIVNAISTVDNPFDPINNFDDWFGFERSQGYTSCQILDCYAHTSSALSEEANEKIINEAIDYIVHNKFAINKRTGSLVRYKKVSKEVSA